MPAGPQRDLVLVARTNAGHRANAAAAAGRWRWLPRNRRVSARAPPRPRRTRRSPTNSSSWCCSTAPRQPKPWSRLVTRPPHDPNHSEIVRGTAPVPSKRVAGGAACHQTGVIDLGARTNGRLPGGESHVGLVVPRRAVVHTRGTHCLLSCRRVEPRPDRTMPCTTHTCCLGCALHSTPRLPARQQRERSFFFHT